MVLNGWVDGWTNRQTDGWKKRHIEVSAPPNNNNKNNLKKWGWIITFIELYTIRFCY